MRRKPSIDRFEIIGAAVAIFVVGPLVVMALDNDAPLKVTGVAVPTAAVARGAPLQPSYRAIYYRRCSGEGERVFVDATGHVMQIDPYTFRDGILADGRPVALGVERVLPHVDAPVPYGAAPGPARYQNVTHFYCNALQKMLGKRWGLGITFRYPVVDFTVSRETASRIEPPTTVFAPVRADAQPSELDGEAPPPSQQPLTMEKGAVR